MQNRNNNCLTRTLHVHMWDSIAHLPNGVESIPVVSGTF